MKIKFKQIANALTGVSTPVFGLSWTPPETDRRLARELIAFLEDRRALYNPYDIEVERHVVESILQIREALTRFLQSLTDDSDISEHIRAMRAACRKFMNEAHDNRLPNWEFFTKLGQLRGVFGIHVAQLSAKYGIDVEEELASILPIEADDSQEPSTRHPFSF